MISRPTPTPPRGDAALVALRRSALVALVVGLGLAYPSNNPQMFEYFLNPTNHRPGAPLDFISYHFYATPTPDETIDNWQYTFFIDAEGHIDDPWFGAAVQQARGLARELHVLGSFPRSKRIL